MPVKSIIRKMKKFLRQLRAQFHYSKFCLSYNDWKAFSYSPWLPYKWHFQILYIMYRWILATYFLGWLVHTGLNVHFFFFIYLTFWSLLSFNIYLTWSATVVTVQYLMVHGVSKNKEEDNLVHDFSDEDDEIEKPKGLCGAKSNGIRWYHMVQWLLFTIGVEMEIIVMLLYWPWAIQTHRPHVLRSTNINAHLMSGLVAIVDIFVSGIPIQLFHFIYLQIFATAYVTFSGVYFAVNGTNPQGDRYIYDTLNYEDSPGVSSAIVVCGVLVFIPIYHCVLHLVYAVRQRLVYLLYKKCIDKRRQNYQELQQSVQAKPPYFS